MLDFQLLTIEESSFLKKEMVAEVLNRFFCLPLVHCKIYVILSTTHTQSSLYAGLN